MAMEQNIALVIANEFANLAHRYLKPDLYEVAQRFLQHSVKLFIANLGKETVEVAQAMNNLAEALRRQLKYDEAEPLLRESIEIRQHLLGENHPSIRIPLNNLGLLYRQLGRFEDAEACLLHSIALYQKAGEQGLEFADALNNLARLYVNCNRTQEAVTLFEQVLDLRVQLLGANQANVGITRNDLAECYRLLGRREEARALYETAINILTGVLGPEHRVTAQVRANYDQFLSETG